MHKVKTARGVEIDFNELMIKQQLSATPPSIDVQARDHFVEQRLKRRSRRKAVQSAQQLTEDTNDSQLDNIDEPDAVQEPVAEKVRMRRG
jgi:hypothetical protein